MRQVQLNDQVYSEAENQAISAGFKSVDEYIADLVTHDMFDSTENLDHLFTPERIAHIDRAVAQIAEGKVHTAAQVREHFRKRFEA